MGKREEAEWTRRSEKVSNDDVGSILAQEDKAMKTVEKSSALRKFKDDLALTYSLIKAYWNGEYREVPWATIAGLVGCLVYVISPIDLVPDFIPVAGFLDDATVVGLALSAFHMDLETFSKWLAKKNG